MNHSISVVYDLEQDGCLPLVDDSGAARGAYDIFWQSYVRAALA